MVMALLWPWPVAAAPVAVRFAEGVTHGFLLLRTVDGGLIASGDLLQIGRGAKVESFDATTRALSSCMVHIEHRTRSVLRFTLQPRSSARKTQVL